MRPLHIAAEYGHVDMVEQLLKGGCNEDAKSDKTGETPLHIAAKCGRVKVVRKLINWNCHKEIETKEGLRPLHTAAEHGREDVVDALIQAGCQQEATTKMHRETALHVAAKSGKNAVVELLLDITRPDKAAADVEGRSLLHLAASEGHAEVVDLLLAAEWDQDAVDLEGGTPLHLAASEGHEHIVAKLLEHPNRPCQKEATDEKGRTPLHLAAECGHHNVVRQLLLDYDCDKDSRDVQGSTPLHSAASRNRLPVVELLLSDGCDQEATDAERRTPLHMAALAGCKDIVELLLQKNSDQEAIDHECRTPLHLAAYGGCRDVVQFLMKKFSTKETKDDQGRTPLHLAVLKGSLPVIQLHIDEHCNKEAQDHKGRTPLHIASFINADKDVVHLLLESQCDKEAMDKEGKTPLHLAAAACLRDVAELLLGKGSNKEVGDKKGRTPLHIAAIEGSRDVVDLLLRKRCNQAATDRKGWAPVHHAAREGKLEVVKLLVAEMTKEPTNGERTTPLHLAAQEGHNDVVKLLLVTDFTFKDSADKNGQIPLHLAAFGGHQEVVKCLLDGGCSKDIRDKHGNTPLHCAGQSAWRDLLDFMVCHGCNQDLKNAAGLRPEEVMQDALFRRRSPRGRPATAMYQPLAEDHWPEASRTKNYEGGYDLFDPHGLVDFLVNADVRLVRLEYLVELLESSKALPRRQEAEEEKTSMDAPALVAPSELRQVDVNPETFHASIMVKDPTPRRLTVRFVSISHVWESREHPDPWRFQLQSVVDKYRLRLLDSVVWIFFDFLSLYQYERDEAQDRVFRLALQGMHLLYSHEAVEVQRIEALASKEVRDDCLARNGSLIPVYWEDEKKVTDVPIDQLKLNETPYSLRGWCQAETQWAALRTSMKDECPVPLPPHIFRERMKRLLFTHREDSDTVFELHDMLFRHKAATTTQLLVAGLSVERIADLTAALPFYSELQELVLTVTTEHVAWKAAAAVVESGACDVQIECNNFGDEEAICLSEALSNERSQHLERLHLICDCLSELGQKALERLTERRRGTVRLSCHLVIESKDRNRGYGYGGHESRRAQPQQTSTTLRVLVHRRRT
ncbi:ANK1 [Symbiodinium sp. CCMP2592]|nr:ANK1 [Symbiodinium sp. CCMP2592]